MSLDIFWFLPTSGDTRYLGTSDSGRPATNAYMRQIAVTAEQLGYDGLLIPTGASCLDPWVTAASLVPVTQRIKLLVENVWATFLISPFDMARFIDEIGSPWVQVHFDVGNIIHYGWPEQWIRILGHRIQTLHIKEYSTKLRDEKGAGAGFGVKFLEGTNNWPAIMAALDKIGYSGWGIAEQGGGGSPEGLKDLSDRMTKIFAS